MNRREFLGLAVIPLAEGAYPFSGQPRGKGRPLFAQALDGRRIQRVARRGRRHRWRAARRRGM